MKTPTKMNSLLIIIACTLGIMISCNSQPSTGNQEGSKSGVEAPDKDLHTAVITNDLDAVKQHIKAGSNLDEPDPFGGSSPLITAALFGQEEIAKALLDAGAKINFKNNEGSTALHTASFFCEKEIVRLLLEKGADKSMRNKYGATPLESVSGPFSEVVGIYQMMDKQLSPMGLEMDLSYIEETRPEVAAMLK